MKVGDEVCLQYGYKQETRIVSHMAPVFVDFGKKYQGYYLDDWQLILDPIDDEKDLKQ